MKIVLGDGVTRGGAGGFVADDKNAVAILSPLGGMT